MNISQSCFVSDDVEGAVVPLVDLRGEGIDCDPVTGIGGEDGEGGRRALEVRGAKLG